MRNNPALSWFATSLETWALCADAAAVVGLRSAKIARGGAAGAAEAQLMVEEKLRAAATVNAALLTGRYGSDPQRVAEGVLGHYGRAVRANRRRLSGG
jgi:hypothetical protein